MNESFDFLERYRDWERKRECTTARTPRVKVTAILPSTPTKNA